MTTQSPTLRLATEQDIPSLIALVLTSFRSFPLFEYLYSPLNTNLDYFQDTIYHWTARFLLGISDPATEIIVAELPAGGLQAVGEGEDEAMRKGWEAWGWLERNGMDMERGEEEMVVVGYAVWEVRMGSFEAANSRSGIGDMSAEVAERCQAIIQEVNTHTSHSPRQDQSKLRMEAFRKSEADLKKQFYALPNPTLYLDGLCVDFRYQRRGIGKDLLATGLNLARAKALDIWTEASPMGLWLYLKVGFRQVGEFVVENPEGGEGIKMPVLKFEPGA